MNTNGLENLMEKLNLLKFGLLKKLAINHQNQKSFLLKNLLNRKVREKKEVLIHFEEV
jgi:hypothetical protein